MNKKKLLVCTLLILFFTHTANAQPWAATIKSSNPTFTEIQTAFYNYWKDKTIEKGKGYKPFKRWEWYWQQRTGIDGKFPPSDVLLTAAKKYNQQKIAKKIPSTLGKSSWTFMGPDSTAGGYRGLGRINCIAFHPTDTNTFWVGTPSGGIWKTTNAGLNWTTNSDNLPVLGVSDIAINPINPAIMYVATGDGESAFSLQNGYGDTKSVGILKSIDGGINWNTTGLNWDFASRSLIRRLIINPINPQILLAATSKGIYRTADAGVSWTMLQSGWFMDIEFKPNNPDFIYAATFDPVGGNAQIFTTTNGGLSWNQVTNFIDIIRINLAVSQNSPELVDALCVNKEGGLNGMYTSTNSGTSFTKYYTGNCKKNLLSSEYLGTGCGGQGVYDLAFAINPSNANDIWLGGVNTWQTADGGTNWLLKNVWSQSQTNTVPVVHADKHFIAFHPLNNNLVYECNDGGVYVTSNAGATWKDLTNGIGISQIYRMGVNQQLSNNIFCGLQDNGTKEANKGKWNDQTGGDGMECIIDYTDGNIKYATYVNGLIYKTTDGGNSWAVIVGNTDAAGTVQEPGEWVTPYIMHPTNNKVLLVGKSAVYRTNDGGTSWSKLGLLPGIRGKIIAMSYAPSDPATIYVATPYQVFKSVNAGGSWTQIKATTSRVTYLAVSPADPLRLYVSFSGYTDTTKVNMSADGGVTWSNYSGTLPNVPVNTIVYETGSDEGMYIGTDLGVFYKNASLPDWVPYNTGLPNVVVNELEISYNDRKLWAATFGRGLWKTDLFPTAITYSFIGDGDWTLASNWLNNSIPPNPLISGSIIIDHTAAGKCNLNINQSILNGSSLIVKTGKNLIVNGTLQIQN